MSPAKLRWGLLFITVGGLLLATKSGWLSDYYWLELLEWWPVLLIAIGVEKIFLKTDYRIISYLSPIALAALMVYLAVDVGQRNSSSNYFSRLDWSEEVRPEVKLLRADINSGKYDLRVSRSVNYLAEVRADRYSRKPDIDFAADDTSATLEIDEPMISGGIIVFHDGKYSDDWRLFFSDQVPLDLKCRGKESDINLTLTEIPVRAIDIDDDEGDIYLKLGGLSPRVMANIGGDDARLTFRLPQGTGLKVIGENYGGYLRTLGMEEAGDAHFSPDYDSASVQVELEIKDQLRHLSIEYY